MQIVLVWCFYDHKCRHGVMFTQRSATRKKTAYVIIISHYVLTECNKCLIYSRFYCFSCFRAGTIDCKKAGTSHHNIGRGVRAMSFVKMWAFQKGGA